MRSEKGSIYNEHYESHTMLISPFYTVNVGCVESADVLGRTHDCRSIPTVFLLIRADCCQRPLSTRVREICFFCCKTCLRKSKLLKLNRTIYHHKKAQKYRNSILNVKAFMFTAYQVIYDSIISFLFLRGMMYMHYRYR